MVKIQYITKITNRNEMWFQVCSCCLYEMICGIPRGSYPSQALFLACGYNPSKQWLHAHCLMGIIWKAWSHPNRITPLDFCVTQKLYLSALHYDRNKIRLPCLVLTTSSTHSKSKLFFLFQQRASTMKFFFFFFKFLEIFHLDVEFMPISKFKVGVFMELS